MDTAIEKYSIESETFTMRRRTPREKIEQREIQAENHGHQVYYVRGTEKECTG